MIPNHDSVDMDNYGVDDTKAMPGGLDPMQDPRYHERRRPTSKLKTWVDQLVAPPTLIALIAFGSTTAVAYYRIGRLEVDIQEVRLKMDRDDRLYANTYVRRDVLLEQLTVVNERMNTMIERLRGIEDELRSQRDPATAASIAARRRFDK